MADAATRALRGRLTAHLSADSVSPRAKIPYKARLLRECLLHRVSDLADSACHVYRHGQIIPAFILSRSAFETAGVLFYLKKQIAASVASRTLANLDEEKLMRIMFGQKIAESQYAAINVLTTLKYVNAFVADGNENRAGAMTRFYDNMCEFAHPNYMGCVGTYMQELPEWRVVLGRQARTPPASVGLRCLRVVIDLACDSADHLERLNVDFRALCERELESGKTP